MGSDYNRHLSLDDVRGAFKGALHTMRKFYSGKIEFEENPNSDEGHVIVDTFHPPGSRGADHIKIVIGMKSVFDNIEGDFVRDEDAVWAVREVFHEIAHVWQYCAAYNSKSASDLFKHMAREYVVGSFFKEYRGITYALDSTEISADIYGLRMCKGWFHTYFPDVDIDYIAVECEKDRRCNVFSGLYGCYSVEDIEHLYKVELHASQYCKKFSMNQILGYAAKNDVLLGCNLLDFINSESGLMLESAKNNMEELDVLCKYIGKKAPEYFRIAPIIRDQYVGYNASGVRERCISRILGIEQRVGVSLPTLLESDEGYDFGIDIPF